jgi:hypothetical protein
MPKPELITARYAQGLADYKAGHGLATVFGTLVAIEEMHDEVEQKSRALGDDESTRQLCRNAHDEISNSIPSYLVGFFEGFLSDFRRVVGEPGRTGALDATALAALKQDAGLTA